MPGTALHIDDSLWTQHYRASLGASCCCLLWWYRHLFFQNDCSSPSGLSPFRPSCCIYGDLCKMKIKPCYSPKKLLITLNRNSNALHHLRGPEWSEPCLSRSPHRVPLYPFPPWSPLSLCNTTCPSHLGASASAQNDLPSSSMPSPLEVVGEAFTDTHPPFKKSFSPHLESHHHVYFLLRT